MKQYSQIGVKEERCKKCGGLVVIRKRRIIPTKRNFYFTQWDFCTKCHAVFFEEKYKSQDWQEDERQQSFFRDLKNDA